MEWRRTLKKNNDMTISESLKAINLYPINKLTLDNIAEECELCGSDPASAEVRASKAYKRAQAKVYRYLATAPAVTESGAQYSFTDAERDRFNRIADDLMEEAGIEDDPGANGEVGYIGEDW